MGLNLLGIVKLQLPNSPNLKFIEDFKIELINHSIDLNLYQLIIDICTYINDKKNYSYEYVIYDINSFFDLYNKDISSME